MSSLVSELALKISSASISPDSRCYRPPSWPPPADWVVSEDVNGNPLSLWGDRFWDFSALVGRTFILDFAGGEHHKTHSLNPTNQALLRMLTTWIIWGHRGVQSWASLETTFQFLRRTIVLCEREGIVASQLSRFPRLLPKVAKMVVSKREKKRLLVIFDRLFRAREEIGFTLLDEQGLRYLSKNIAETDDDNIEQTAYIPPRIWTYQVIRLRECLDDFLAHRQQVEDCFQFCIDAYAHNFGSLENALIMTAPSDSWLPFTKQQRKTAGNKSGRRYYGSFEATAHKFGITSLLQRWVLPPNRKKIGIKSISSYLSLVQYVGLAYIANFTLQRIEEAEGLRSDCLLWEDNSGMGRFAIIRGDTTKTDPDSDARWPTSPSVEVAVDAMTAVAKMRMRCAAAIPTASCSDYDKTNPYLFHRAFEPWASKTSRSKPYAIRSKAQDYQYYVRLYPNLFDPKQLRITEDDLNTARMFTPNLNKKGKFKVGKVWPLAWHQLRRTGAVNMFASGLLSDTSIQVIMKHLTLMQTRYYGTNYSRVRFNGEYEQLTVGARYEVVGKQIAALTEDRYVSPLGEQRKQEIVVNLIGTRDFKALVKAGRKGEVSFRETRLGGCTKRGDCKYGGIESVAACAGGGDRKPCRDALFDRTKRKSVERQLAAVEQQTEQTQPDSPRMHALEAEANGLRSYLDVVGE